MTLFQAFGQFASSGALAEPTMYEMIVPTSVTSTGGTATISANGGITLTGNSTAVQINGVFSSTYTHYQMVMRYKQNTSAQPLLYQFSAGGTPNTSSVYEVHEVYASSTTVSSSTFSTLTRGNLMYLDPTNSRGAGFIVDFYYPAQSVETVFRSRGVDGGNSQVLWYTGVHNTAYAADGINMFPGGDSITLGIVSFYGYVG